MNYADILVAGIVLISMVASRAQVQQFGTYGPALFDNSQYQTSGGPIQGLRLQVTNPAALSALPSGQQSVAPSSFAYPQLAPQSAYTSVLPQHYQQTQNQDYQQLAQPQQFQQLAQPQQFQQLAHPQQYQQLAQQQQYQQPLQLPESVLTSAAQFRNSVRTIAQPARFRNPAPVKQNPEETDPSAATVKTAPAPIAGLLGVAFSPASEVSQLRFSGSFANYSY